MQKCKCYYFTAPKDASSVDGVLYAFIINKKMLIKAHTDFDLVGKTSRPVENKMDLITEGKITYFNFTEPSGERMLNLSSPILFKEKRLGEVHVGISLDFIEEQIQKEVYSILIIGFIVVIIGVCVASLLGITFSRPIHQLVMATREVGKGNFSYKIRMKRGDELGDLADSFNFMANELKMKSLMQETFGRYVSPEILDMILAHPEETWLKGTRGEASIIFTDIRGFTAYSESREPEEVVEILNKYFKIVTEAILDYGGYVDKFIGDAVLAVFGIPIVCSDHAEKAVKASCEIQRRLKEAAGDHPLLGRVGIGINSGVAVSGNLGSDVKMEYSVIGDSVNVASRLNSLAGEGEIIISETSLRVIQKLLFKWNLFPPKRSRGNPIL